MALRRSYTATIERNVAWRGEFVTEPYEVGWASEAIFFVRALAAQKLPRSGWTELSLAYVQISADGIRWVDEGSRMELPTAQDQVVFCRVSHFGGWLRLRGSVRAGAALTVLVSLSLKE